MPIYALDGVSPTLPPEARFWIAPDAHLVGNVHIDVDVSIWFGAAVRGDNDRISIGARTNIQDGCLLHVDRGYPLQIGAGCTIGHHAIVHGCAIGDNTLIGMGATVLNGVKVGCNCLVGANSLLTEHKIFPDDSLIIGSPARVVRKLNDKDIAQLHDTAALYIRNWRRYASGLEPVRADKLHTVKA